MSSHNTPSTTDDDDYNIEVEQHNNSDSEDRKIEVHFLLETVTEYCALSHDGSRRNITIVDSEFTSNQASTFTFDFVDFFQRPQYAYAALLDQLTTLQLNPRDSDEVIREILSLGRDHTFHCGPSNVPSLAFDVTISRRRSVLCEDYEWDLESRAMRESMVELERINDGRVAASEEAVKRLLKGVIVEDESHMNCPICLEEFKIGSYARGMPCSHLFHGDCIRFWLKESHYCPLCRFEMPTH